MKAFANMHWPGLYSIPVEQNPDGGLVRLFIAKPGQLHPDLQNRDSVFLYHNHAYNLRSTTVLGVVENHLYETVDEGGEPFHRYWFKSAVGAGEARLQHNGIEQLRWCGREVCQAGDTYYITRNEIHRVVFHPDRKTGWFAAKLTECRPVRHPGQCWSKHYLQDIPYKDQELYHPLTADAAQKVLEGLYAAGGRW